MRDTAVWSLPTKGATLEMLAQTEVVWLWRDINLIVKWEQSLPTSVGFAQLSLLGETCKCAFVGPVYSASSRVSPDWKCSHIVHVAGEDMF